MYVRVYPNNGFINRSARVQYQYCTPCARVRIVAKQHFLEDFSCGNGKQATGNGFFFLLFCGWGPIVVCINLWLHSIFLIN